MPSRLVQELQSGIGMASMRPSDPAIPHGIAVPGSFTEEDEVDDLIGGAWTSEDRMPVLIEDCEGLKWAFLADTADTEALEPRTLSEAKRHLDWALWEQAIEEELTSLKAVGTWHMEEPPPGANVISSKWVFKAKKDTSSRVVHYKARLVVQGFSQIDGVDYDDTFVPIAKLASTRVILAMANRLDMELEQFDVKAAYLNRELDDGEVLYMCHPLGYKLSDAGTRVLHLRKALYGLKQVGRRWYQTLTHILLDLGFTQCSVDQAVFHKSNLRSGARIVVVVYVDDCTVAADSMALVNTFRTNLSEHIKLTDLGQLHWMLGLEVKHDCEAGSIHLSQHTYLDSIIQRFSCCELKLLSTPFDTQVRLTLEQAPASTEEFAIMRDVPYREAVGMLNWAALATRPDIAFAVATVARFAVNPGPAHWDAVKCIYCYLSGMRDLWLSYGETQWTLKGFADMDGSMAEDRRAISGYAFLIDGGVVSWFSKKQELVSLSTTESKYVAATHGMKEALWLRSLLEDAFAPVQEPTTLFSDNQSTITLTKDHRYHARTKHIDVRYHFIHWVVERGSLRLVYCPTANMVADALTKALPSVKVKHFAGCLGLRTV
jgi:hypothetical protein